MRNLFLRIFVTFWTAMVLVLTFTVATTLWLADERAQREQSRQDQLASEASSVLASQGVPGLRQWLAYETLQVVPDRLYVLDRHGDDLLGRHVPEFLRARFGRGRIAGSVPELPPDTRDVRWLSQLIAPGDEPYALSLLRLRRSPLGIFNPTETPIVTGIATLMIGTIVCLLLARYLADPIRHLRAATRSIANGDLSVRVSSLMGARRDELAMLALDFDLMAERLRGLLESHRELLRDVSHELRSPLARLQIALGLARRPSADLGRELDRIDQEVSRLDELIGEILSLSRLDDPAHTLQAEPVNIEELLETLIDNARLEAEPRSIRVLVTTLSSMTLSGDRELLFRALENVLRNAVRFSPDGAAVELALEHAGDAALIRISDRGPGVPTEALQRIFEPFFSVAKARDRDSAGYGIGLAITARVVALHGGSVRANNRPEGGLQVEIRLPLQRLSAAPESGRHADLRPPRYQSTADTGYR
jgi:two-component system, OmpR family, sensor kinase